MPLFYSLLFVAKDLIYFQIFKRVRFSITFYSEHYGQWEWLFSLNRVYIFYFCGYDWNSLSLLVQEWYVRLESMIRLIWSIVNLVRFDSWDGYETHHQSKKDIRVDRVYQIFFYSNIFLWSSSLLNFLKFISWPKKNVPYFKYSIPKFYMYFE